MALEKILQNVIKVTGPLSLSQFMRTCLTNPQYGYYTNKDPLGTRGDFTTSPEISQVFGELVGVWYAKTWIEQGSPQRVNFIEFGPGKGTLMSDVLRVFHKLTKENITSKDVIMVEASPVLKEKQWSVLSHEALNKETWSAKHKYGGGSIKWVDTEVDIEVTKKECNYIIAHEFFDALPVNKFLKCEDGWKELLVDYRDHGFVMSESKLNVPSTSIVSTDERYDNVAVGSTVEVCPELYTYTKKITSLIGDEKGAALVIDYGSSEIPSESLRGIKNHKFVDPLTSPGEVDLSTDVDFSAIKKVAEGNGLSVKGPVPQGDWLLKMGIQLRTQQLLETVKDDKTRESVLSAYHRLVDKDEMGKVYKVMGLLPK